jgi:RNA polymerase sigma-70 factor, ECF subfamily
VANSTAEDLFGRHRRDVYRFLLRMSGRRDVADDLVQEVFLHVVRALQNGGPIGHERGWIFSVARNVLADRHRRSQREIVVVDEPLEQVKQATQGLSVGLAESLALLAEADRETFLLREVGGLSYQEIADVCGCTIDSVRSRLHRARVELRTTLIDGR